jgi:hypothetical protein
MTCRSAELLPEQSLPPCTNLFTNISSVRVERSRVILVHSGKQRAARPSGFVIAIRHGSLPKAVL